MWLWERKAKHPSRHEASAESEKFLEEIKVHVAVNVMPHLHWTEAEDTNKKIKTHIHIHSITFLNLFQVVTAPYLEMFDPPSFKSLVSFLLSSFLLILQCLMVDARIRSGRLINDWYWDVWW